MNDFALYNTLKNDLPSKDLTATQKAKLVDSISTLTPQGMELVYALIKYHNIHDKKNNNLYNHKRMNTRNATCDISWNLNDIPIKLRNILLKFTQLEERRRGEMDNRIANMTQVTKMNSELLGQESLQNELDEL